MAQAWDAIYWGDLQRDTCDLTNQQHGIYLRLLAAYYTQRKPLDANIPAIERIVVAMTVTEKRDLKIILARFFTLQDGKYSNRRADIEIAKRGEISQAARDSANARWGNKSVRNRYETDTTAYANASKTHMPNECAEPCENDANHNHNYNHQSQNLKSKSTALSGKPDELAQFSGNPQPKKPKSENQELAKQAREALDFLNAKTGKAYRPVDANLRPIIARLKSGASLQDMRCVIAKKFREWGKDEKMCEYLRPATLFNATKFEQYLGEIVPDAAESMP